MSTVAICTLLEDSKADLLPILVPRWNAVDLGGRERVYVACVHDACEATVREFCRLTKGYNVRLVRPSLGELADRSIVAVGGYTDPRFILRIALMREAVRVAALDTKASLYWWLDSDIDPEGGEAPSFGCLYQTLTSTRGPLRPRLVSGLYCTRFGGATISQWLDGVDQRYIYLRAGAIQASRVAGFGCMLVPRSVMRWASWAQYPGYIEQLMQQRAEHPEAPAGMLGEDCWLIRGVEGAGYHQAPCYVDNRVLCNHFHADGSYWTYRPDGDVLVPRYVPAGLAPGAAVTIRYTGVDPLTWPVLGRTVNRGDVVRMSPELVETMRVLVPGQYEEVAA